jgi:hypothetical protein
VSVKLILEAATPQLDVVCVDLWLQRMPVLPEQWLHARPATQIVELKYVSERVIEALLDYADAALSAPDNSE